MKAVLQRVTRAKVVADGVLTGEIGLGLLIFLGIGEGDTIDDIHSLVKKILGVRLFADNEGKFNLNLEQAGGDCLVISQFTLYGDLKKGTRPSFSSAMAPQSAIPLYGAFVEELRLQSGKAIPTGVFGAYMQIEAIHDGPVTLNLDTR